MNRVTPFSATAFCACLLGSLLLTTACRQDPVEPHPGTTQGSGNPSPGSGNGEVPCTMNDSLPALQSADLVAPYVGVWENEDGQFVLVYLPDGRAASNDRTLGRRSGWRRAAIA